MIKYGQVPRSFADVSCKQHFKPVSKHSKFTFKPAYRHSLSMQKWKQAFLHFQAFIKHKISSEFSLRERGSISWFEGRGMMGTAIVAASPTNHVLLFVLFCLFLLSSTLELVGEYCYRCGICRLFFDAVEPCWVPLSLRHLPTLLMLLFIIKYEPLSFLLLNGLNININMSRYDRHGLFLILFFLLY